MDKNNFKIGTGRFPAYQALPSALKESTPHEHVRSAPMTSIVRFAVIAVTAALFLGSAMHALSGQRDLAVIFALAAPLGISAWGFARAGHNEPAIALLCLVLTTVVTLVLLLSPRGIHDSARTAYGGIVLVGALLLSRRAYIVLAGVTLLAASAAFAVDIWGLSRSQFPRSDWVQYVEFMVILVMFAVLGRVSAEILFGSLGKAHEATSDDPLTGCANRQGFFEEASQMLKRMQPGAHAALVLCDLEAFRRINIVIGHRAADSVLSEAARRIRETDGNKLVGRIGDDEFAVIASVADDAAAREYAARIHQVMQFEFSGVSVRTSTGYARFPRDAHGLESLLLAAEGSLANARQERIRFAGPGDRI